MLIGLVVGLGSSAAPPQDEAEEGRQPPNIVLILADDLGIGDARCYNQDSKIPTPQIDRLAALGVRFSDAHAPAAVCTPTRYGILTGRYAWRSSLKSGVLWGNSPLLPDPDRTTLPDVLRAGGYHTAYVGKWHLGLGADEETDFDKPLIPGPLELGFDTFYGNPASPDIPPYLYIRDHDVVTPASGFTRGSDLRRVNGDGFWRPGPIASDYKHEEVLPKLTDEAIAYLEQRAQERDTPFFLYFALGAPHVPWMPTEPFQGASEAGWYGDFVAMVDDSVGRIAAALKRLKLGKDTLLVVTSDNGAHWDTDDRAQFRHRANHYFRGQKGDIWEGGHRVPFIARWPGKTQAGSVRSELICLTDFLATCAELVELDLEDDVGEDSYSFLAALTGRDPTGPVREAIVHHSYFGMFSIREGPWKLIQGLGSGGFTEPYIEIAAADGPLGQLYNLTDDIREQRNLYREEPEVVARLRALLAQYEHEGRSRPRRETNPDRAEER